MKIGSFTIVIYGQPYAHGCSFINSNSFHSRNYLCRTILKCNGLTGECNVLYIFIMDAPWCILRTIIASSCNETFIRDFSENQNLHNL